MLSNFSNKIIKSIKFSLLFLLIIVSQTSCEDSDTEIVLETGTVTDIEGTTYQTVKIGNQWWMAEDLRTTTYRSGLSIPQINDDEQWARTKNPAYTIYENSALAPGLLYNFHVITSLEEIAPEGWHIPTDEEWQALESYLGLPGSELELTNWRGTDQGDMLKVEGTEGWTFYEGVWANNETGFSAYGGSSRFYEGPFGVPGLKGSSFYWTSSVNNDKGWFRYLDYKKSGIFRFFGHPNYGFSIRCVKDN